jgi:hypothetical protein
MFKLTSGDVDPKRHNGSPTQLPAILWFSVVSDSSSTRRKHLTNEMRKVCQFLAERFRMPLFELL